MRELDVVLARYLEHDYPHGPEAHQQAFEALLALQDPEILAVLLGREPLPADPDLAHVFTVLAQYRD